MTGIFNYSFMEGAARRGILLEHGAGLTDHRLGWISFLPRPAGEQPHPAQKPGVGGGCIGYDQVVAAAHPQHRHFRFHLDDLVDVILGVRAAPEDCWRADESQDHIDPCAMIAGTRVR